MHRPGAAAAIPARRKMARISPPQGTVTGGAIVPNPAVADATREGATPDVPMLARPMSGKVARAAPSLAMPPSGTAQPASPGRVVLGVGEPEPPISGRPDGLGGSLMEPKRITPRSPRAALEPDHVPAPSRPSRRARNPLVIVGNAVFTALVLVLIVVGAAVVFGKSWFEAPGPLQEDKVVNIGGVFALKARTELKAGEYLFPKRASMKDVVETILEGKVVQHQITIPEGLTSEQIVARLLENEILSGNIKD